MKPRRPRIGQLEADYSRQSPPLIGTMFDVNLGGETCRAKVMNVSRLSSPQTRQMGVITATMTHVVEFVVP
jgi:hypothetical protein